MVGETLEKQARLIDLAPAATIVRELDGTVIFWNQGAQSLYGWSKEEALGRRTHELLHTEFPEPLENILRTLARGGKWSGELRHTTKDGRRLIVQSYWQAKLTNTGEIEEILESNADITERKRAEEALRESEARFRALAENVSQLVWVADEQGWISWYNQRWFDYTGTTLEEVQGWGWQRVHHPEHLQRVLAKIRRCFETGEAWEDTFPLRGKDGQYRWFLSRAMPIRDESGRIVRWFGTNTDVTELRERESALRKQARLIDLAPAATMVRRPDGTITFWSRGAERLYGWSREEAVGRRTQELLRTEFSEPLENIVAKVKLGGTWSGELRHYTRDGRLLTEQSYWLAEIDANGEVSELLESNTDITEYKKLQEHLEDEVKQRTERLLESNAQLEAFSYSLSHDMRGPLRAILSFTQLAMEDCQAELSGTAREYLEKASGAARRLDQLIQDVLALSRLSRRPVVLSAVNLDRLVRDMIQERPDLQEPRAEVRVQGSLLPVQGHEALLTQIVGNLLGNAVKFVAPGTKPQVKVRTETRGGKVRLWVEDNGIGVEEHAQERIFELFGRNQRTKDYEGTGIGLAIVRKAAERMGGQAGVESRVGSGSRFWVDFAPAV